MPSLSDGGSQRCRQIGKQDTDQTRLFVKACLSKYYGSLKWATSRENLFLPYANNKGADQLAHPRSLISTFVVRCRDSIISLVSISKISNLKLASVAVQAGLNFTWSETPKTGFLVTRLKYIQSNTRLMQTKATFTQGTKLMQKPLCGRAVSAPDFGPWGRGFESC